MTEKTSGTSVRMMLTAIAFVRWADSFHRPITVEDIRDRWQVSRATSYRWLQAYNAVPARHRLAAQQSQVAA